ncbi:MAG: IS21-like element helper ATPase IstB [Burkholderiales bacterium]
MMETNLLLESQLKALRLPTFVQNYRRFAQDAARNNQTFDRFLLALAEQEVSQRDLNRQRQALKAAHFPLLKELVDFDFSAIPQLNKQRILDLARGEYLHQKMPIILVGNPGLGKTHVATGLAAAACRQGYRVRFYNTAALVNELLLAQEQHRLPKFLAAALKHHLIVLDELGFIPFSATGAQLIFQFCSTLHERVALIVTTNLKFADWTQIFGNEQLTAALLDRLTHHAHILEFIGESFRFRQRLQQDPSLV